MSIFLDLFGEDYRELDRLQEQERREGPCEDDYEVKCPYIGIMPEETLHEESSPINFKEYFPTLEDSAFIDSVLWDAFKRGVT